MLALVLEADVQGVIDAVIKRTHTDTGIGHGYLDAEDVRSSLQETAVRALHRYDPSLAKVTTFLWPRLWGAAIQLVRVHGVRTRAGNVRVHPASLDQRLRGVQHDAVDDRERAVEWPRPLDGGEALADPQAAEALEGVNELADLTLALSQMPSRLRLVLYLLFYEQLQLDQVAARLATTVEAVRALRDAALTKMRLALLRRG